MTRQPQGRGGAAPSRRKKRRGGGAGRLLGIGAILALAAGAGFVWKLSHEIGVGLSDITWVVRNPRAQFPGKERVNILVVGKDYSYLWAKGNTNSGMPYTKESRADTLVMVSLDLQSNKATALSIPRDSWVKAPDGQSGKINATYRRGGEKLLVGTVTKLLGVEPTMW